MKLIGLLFVFSMAARAEQVVVQCTNGEETNIKIIQRSDAGYRAEATVQSVGDSYPTYRFNDIQLLPQSRIPGAPAIYQGVDFELKVFVGPQLRGVLRIPGLGIEDQELKCKSR